jgi:hypothetical protein
MLEHIFKDKDVVIFGELYGKNINSGSLYSDNYEFKVFDISMPISDRPISRKYVSRKIVEEICKELGFDVVPLVMVGTIDQAIDFISKNEKSTFSDAELEGLVGVPKGNLLDENGERIIIKIKRRDIPSL